MQDLLGIESEVKGSLSTLVFPRRGPGVQGRAALVSGGARSWCRAVAAESSPALRGKHFPPTPPVKSQICTAREARAAQGLS